MKMNKAIKVEYLAPTNTLGGRLKFKFQDQSLIIHRNQCFDYEEQISFLIDSYKIEVIGSCYIDNDVIILVADGNYKKIQKLMIGEVNYEQS
jgi:hypothetical protein